MQIILNSFKTDIAHCSAVVADYTHIGVVIIQPILMSQSEKQLVIATHETNTMKFYG